VKLHGNTSIAPSLRARMLRSGAWLVGGNLGSQVLRLASNLVLTRLLLPQDFGLMAAVNTLYFALVMFSDLGVWQSVVKSPHGNEARFLGTAWSVQLARGALLALAVLGMALGLQLGQQANVFAPDTVYADSRLPWMMTVFALCALLQGGESMRLAIAQRQLHGSVMARLELTSQLAALCVTLALAWWMHTAWALLAGTLTGSAVRTLLSHLTMPGAPVRPCWDRSHLQELLGFGKWIVLSSVVGFLAAHGEKLILGATLGLASFGVFAIAGNLLAAAMGVYSTINARVIFPSLSQALREGHEAELVRVYTRVQQVADLFLGLLTGVLLMAGQWVVWLLYDARYHGAGWMLQWLSLGLLAMRHQVVEQLMFARGLPVWVTANNILRASLLAIAIPAGHALAAEQGAIAGVVLSQFASWPLSLYFKRRQGLLHWGTERWWLPALVAGTAAGAVLDLSLSAWGG
jgi:O-antigen/teichoic acid export membrane protein